MNMRQSYTPGDYEASHDKPVWGDRANFIVAANISNATERKEWEQLWARQIAERRFEICCIPFFVYDLALGDEVETDGDYVIKHVVKSSGHYTFRVWFGEANDAACRETVPSATKNLGCELEWSSKNLLAIDAATVTMAEAAADVLAKHQAAGDLTYETGRTR
jgi:hypothetical protein